MAIRGEGRGGAEGPSRVNDVEVLPSSSVGEESLSPNHPDTSSDFDAGTSLALNI